MESTALVVINQYYKNSVQASYNFRVTEKSVPTGKKESPESKIPLEKLKVAR